MRRISPSTIIASAALFFSLGGVGLAAGRYIITSTSQIKPSVLRHLRGQRGPIGPSGPAGPVGSAARAPAYETTVAHIYATGRSAADRTVYEEAIEATAVCPPGSIVTGGGYELNGIAKVEVRASAPALFGRGWQFKSHDWSAPGIGDGVEVFAVCLRPTEHPL